jgi:hypothetical protein
MFKSCVAGMAIAVALSFSTSAHALQLAQKVALQAAMTQHIEATVINGVIPYVQLSDGKIVDLVPSKAHPMILTFGDKYVLCTDYRDPEGRFVNVDFYIAERNGEFIVFQTEIDNRAAVERLVKSGRAAMVK